MGLIALNGVVVAMGARGDLDWIKPDVATSEVIYASQLTVA
jgi:hypothetical protein